MSAFILLSFSSCNVVKRVKKGDYLVTKNTIIEDDKENKDERINNIIIQKPNTGMNGLLGLRIPLRLHFYNLARPNIDSIIDANILSDSLKVKRKTALLSKKQFDRYIASKRNFNSWLKRTGEAPVILNEDKTKKTVNNLKKYYFSKGWFDNEVDFTIEKDSNKRAEVTYKISKNKAYILDSITPIISTPALDSLYPKIEENSLLKPGMQYDEELYERERSRINSYVRNSGFYHFGQDYIRYVLDTVNHKVNTELMIANRSIRGEDSTTITPFKSYKIRDINIYTDENFDNRFKSISDTTYYKDITLFSKDKLKFKPKALTDAVFIHKDDIYTDLARSRTLRYLNDLQMFRYPTIEYIEHEEDTTLTANIYLEPRKKYGLSFDVDVSQSNIQTIGFSVTPGLKIRNLFRGAETLEISGVAAIGASEDRADDEDTFFDINEFGGNLRLTIPRLFTPFNTEKIIPKYMSPRTVINLAATSQQNIGLDKQTLSGILSYNWFPSKTVTNTVELFNIQYVRNLNTNNYFGVYTNSYDRLNSIAQNIGYIGSGASLSIPSDTDQFIDDVLNGNTSLTQTDNDFRTVNNIEERQQRLTEDNLIFSTSFDYVKNNRLNIFDNDFSIFKWRVELAGNLFSGLSRLFDTSKNENGNYEILNVAFSQYFKTEVDYVKYFDLGRNTVFAFRSYAGIAIPFGNSDNIPFAESFFAGGPNDNRAWIAYNLGPGSSTTTNEFNEANLKLHLSAEQRFPLFGDLRGALFVDVGNIWNVLDNVEEEEATFSNLESIRDIAVGSGFGLRYDFNFFVLRLDTGFKTYEPSLELGNRWFKNYNFRSAVYNIGINYPF